MVATQLYAVEVAAEDQPLCLRAASRQPRKKMSRPVGSRYEAMRLRILAHQRAGDPLASAIGRARHAAHGIAQVEETMRAGCAETPELSGIP